MAETDETARWRNVAAKVEHIEPGDELSIEVEGGYASKLAPHAGLLIESKTGYSIYVPGHLLAVGVEDSEDDDATCIVKNCRSTTVPDLGGMCRPCWAFASGERGGESSTARRNALAAAKSR